MGTVQVTEGSPPQSAYEDLLAGGTFAFQRCSRCHGSVFSPRTICPHCGSTDLAWEESSGRGVIYSSTCLSPRNAAPYVVVLVDVAEGFRMMSRLLDEVDDVGLIGRAVRVVVTDLDGVALPCVLLQGGPHVA